MISPRHEKSFVFTTCTFLTVCRLLGLPRGWFDCEVVGASAEQGNPIRLSSCSETMNVMSLT